MALIQLDFFEETEMSELKARMDKLEKSQDRCRKKQFAEIGDLKKQMQEQKEMLEMLIKNICHAK